MNESVRLFLYSTCVGGGFCRDDLIFWAFWKAAVIEQRVRNTVVEQGNKSYTHLILELKIRNWAGAIVKGHSHQEPQLGLQYSTLPWKTISS